MGAKPFRRRTVPSAAAAAMRRPFVGQRSEGDREAQLLARRDAVLPFAARLAREQISRARRDFEACAPEAARPRAGGSAGSPACSSEMPTTCRTRRGRGASRCPRRDRNARAGRGRNPRAQARERRGAVHAAAAASPGSARPAEARVIEIVAPAEALRLAIAEPAVEAERREVERASRSSSSALRAR